MAQPQVIGRAQDVPAVSQPPRQIKAPNRKNLFTSCCKCFQRDRAFWAEVEAQRRGASAAAAALGVLDNDSAFLDPLNQRSASSLDSRSAQQMANEAQSLSEDSNLIVEWLSDRGFSQQLDELASLVSKTANQMHELQQNDKDVPTALTEEIASAEQKFRELLQENGHGQLTSGLRTCVSCGKFMGLGLLQEARLLPCCHRGISLKAASGPNGEVRTTFCPFCGAAVSKVEAIKAFTYPDREPLSKSEVFARDAAIARVTMEEWKGMSPEDRQEATLKGFETWKSEARDAGCNDTDKRAKFESKKAGMKAVVELGSLVSAVKLLQVESRINDPLRAMQLLGLLPQSLWSSSATTLDESLGRKAFIPVIADEIRFGEEKPDECLPKDGSDVFLIDFEPLLVFTLGASKGRWRTDKGYALCRFLGTPIIDRTESGIIDVGLNVKSLYPIPAFDPSFARSLDDIMLERANEILSQNANVQDIVLLWSGGIDSTSMVVAFLRATMTKPEARHQLLVQLAPRSRDENPSFWSDHISPKLRYEMIEGHVRDTFAGKQVVVTGDPADMLFCTFKITSAFDTPIVQDVDGVTVANPMWMALDEPWQQVLPAMLHVRGLLLNADQDPRIHFAHASAEWCSWISPHVALSPIPVVTVFDFFWWITYSCKYQFDMLRVLRNRDSAEDIKRVMEVFTPFFGTPVFDQWAFHNHNRKMGDKRVWASYKFPLKQYIREFDQNTEYFKRKTKLSSAQMGCGRQVAITTDFQPIAFGAHSVSVQRMEQKYGRHGLQLNRLLKPHVRAKKREDAQQMASDARQAEETMKVAEMARRSHQANKQRGDTSDGGGG